MALRENQRKRGKQNDDIWTTARPQRSRILWWNVPWWLQTLWKSFRRRITQSWIAMRISKPLCRWGSDFRWRSRRNDRERAQEEKGRRLADGADYGDYVEEPENSAGWGYERNIQRLEMTKRRTVFVAVLRFLFLRGFAVDRKLGFFLLNSQFAQCRFSVAVVSWGFQRPRPNKAKPRRPSILKRTPPLSAKRVRE